MTIDSPISGALYYGKTVREVYCGWKNDHTIQHDIYLNKKIEECVENYGLVPGLNSILLMLDSCNISVKCDKLFLQTSLYTHLDHAEQLRILSENRKWNDDIVIFVGNDKYPTKREWYKRDSEFKIGDGDPFYVKYLSELPKEDRNKLYLTNEQKSQLENLAIFKVTDYSFKLIDITEMDEETTQQTYVFEANTEYVTFCNFFK